MTASDFLASAAVAAPLLADTRESLGEIVLRATTASFEVAGCNTNLGIVLLAAPLARATLLRSRSENLRQSLHRVLDGLSRDDASRVFAAIRHAAPGGLGRSEHQDVAEEPTMTLKEVMQLASVRDRIAFQYANDFDDIFELGVPLLRKYRSRWNSITWAAVGVYLGFLARYPDTHVVRKLGAEKAQSVRLAAQELESRYKACENPATFAGQLAAFDRELKQGSVNPGTSADLTVATILALLLLHA